DPVPAVRASRARWLSGPGVVYRHRPTVTGQVRSAREPVLAAHHGVISAGWKYLVHGDETLRDRVDEVAGAGPPRGDRLGDDLGDVLGGGAEPAHQPGLGPAERGTDRSLVRRIGVAVGG